MSLYPVAEQMLFEVSSGMLSLQECSLSPSLSSHLSLLSSLALVFPTPSGQFQSHLISSHSYKYMQTDNSCSIHLCIHPSLLNILTYSRPCVFCSSLFFSLSALTFLYCPLLFLPCLALPCLALPCLDSNTVHIHHIPSVCWSSVSDMDGWMSG